MGKDEPLKGTDVSVIDPDFDPNADPNRESLTPTTGGFIK
jgi:hypothetical protein